MRRIFTISVLALQLFLCNIGHAEVIEILNFNNNQLPTGWQYFFDPGSPGRNVSVQNARLEVGQVDTYGGIRRDLALPTNTGSLKIEYVGNISDVFWGMFSAVQIYNANGGHADIHMAKHGYGVNQMRFGVSQTTPDGSNQAESYLFWQNPDYGTYRVTTTFVNGGVTTSFANVATPTVINTGFLSLSGFSLNQVSSIRLFAATTTGASAWMDDVTITALPVPEPETYLLLLMGLSFIFLLKRKNRKSRELV